MTALHEMLDELRKPFHPSHIEWKPGAVKGERALAIAYADLRAYMNRLDEVCGDEWSVAYEPWGNDRIICRLTIGGVTRSSTGETTNESERSEIGGTVAEAQSFKRAAAMFGLGRYLYNLPSGWVDYDPAKKTFTDKAKAHLMGILTRQYREATEVKAESEKGTPPHQRLWGIGMSVFGTDWDMARPWLLKKWTEIDSLGERICTSASELSDTQKDLFGDYMNAHAAELQKIWPAQKAKLERRAKQAQEALAVA